MMNWQRCRIALAVCVTIALICSSGTWFTLVNFGSPSVLAAPPLQEPQPVGCKKTTVASPACGTAQNLDPFTCGGQTCHRTVITYGLLTNCEGSQGGGLKDCCAGSCNKITTKDYD